MHEESNAGVPWRSFGVYAGAYSQGGEARAVNQGNPLTRDADTQSSGYV